MRVLVLGVTVLLAILLAPLACADSITNDGHALRIQDDGAHLRIAHSASLDLSSALTIELWARFDPIDGTPGAEFVKRGDGNQGYVLGVNPDTRLVGGIFGQHSNLVSSPPSCGDDWHHFAWTYDGSTSRLYFDGTLIQEAAYTGTIGTTTSDLIVGIGIESDGAWNGATAQGWYDEIRVWNVARSSSQIAEAFDHSLFGNESGLVGYWNFGSGDASDLTSFGNHGELRDGARVEAVPEPTTVALVGIGAAAWAWKRRFRRTRRAQEE